MKKEKKYGLLKGALLFIFVAIILSWFIPNGTLSGTGYQSEGLAVRIGLNDLSWLIYYGIYFAIDKIILLLAVGGFYGVITRTEGYDKLVTKIANIFKNKTVGVVILSVLIAAFTSILTNVLAVVVFIPFIISILNRMKLDKMTILATTFGSMLVGVMGATYGTEGVALFTQYMASGDVTVKTAILVRAGILLIGLVLFNFFLISHMRKVEKDAATTDLFVVDELEKGKRTSSVPIIVVSLLLCIFIILGFINWNSNFGITIFDDFHTSVTEVSIGDFHIFKDLLGSNFNAFGKWDLFSISALLMIFTAILGLCYRIKLNDFIASFARGMKKMMKPALCVVGAFMLMVVVYMSPYVATINHWILGLTDSFNIATMTLSAFISNIFHTDLGYTAYLFASYLTTEFPDYINPIYVIFISLYGFVQFFIPTSFLLGIGLTSLDVRYRDWLKYIWKFLLGMLICLIVIFILVAML